MLSYHYLIKLYMRCNFLTKEDQTKIKHKILQQNPLQKAQKWFIILCASIPAERY